MLAGQEKLVSHQMLMELMKQEMRCPICCSRKTTRVWRQLPCGHWFCEKCLEKWYTTKQSDGNKDGEELQARQLSCPFCRRCTTLPQEGIKEFSSQNGGRKDLLDLMAYLKRTQMTQQAFHACALCPSDVEEFSVKLSYFCHEKNLTLCAGCQGRFQPTPSAPPLEEEVPATNPTMAPLRVAWTSEATSDGQYSDGVVIDRNGAKAVVVCDSEKRRLRVFELGGKCVLTEKPSYRPYCMAYDKGSGTILVTKYNSTSLACLDAIKLKEVGKAKKIMALVEPQGLARLDGGETVVAETKKTVAIYDDSAKCVLRWKCDAQPQYVTVSDDTIVVSFRDGNCIVAFDRLGNQKWRVNLCKPRGVAVDKDRVVTVHEGQGGKSEISLFCTRTGNGLGQLDIPPLEVLHRHNKARLIKAIPCEGKLVLVYNHFIQMTHYQ